MSKKELNITVCGERLRLKSDESDDYIKTIVSHLENKVGEFFEFDKHYSDKSMLLLSLIYSSINITDDMFKMMNDYNDVKLELFNVKKELKEFIDSFGRDSQLDKGAKIKNDKQ